MASELALQTAVQAWCTEKTATIEMDVVLAEAFADILDGVWSQPWLGNATTAELIDELKARAEVGGYSMYRTTGNQTSRINHIEDITNE